MTTKHILYLYETAVGLGHQRRASGIVNGLVNSGFQVSVASGSFVDAENYFDPRINLIRLPANRRLKHGVTSYYDADNKLVSDPDFDSEKWQEERVHAILPSVENCKVDAIMAEWWPFKRRKDFDQIIDSIIQSQQRTYNVKPLLISSVRDVIKSGNKDNLLVDNAEGTEKTLVEFINSSVDLIMVHGDPNLVRLEEGVSYYNEIQKPIVYTGYVVNDGAKQTVEQRDNTVYVSCGSGDEGHHLTKAAMKAMPYSSLHSMEWNFVLGPRMDEDHKKQVYDLSESMLQENPALKMVIHPQLSELPKALTKAGFSISLSGYNTTMEVLASTAPSILVPKFMENNGILLKSDMEQWKRLVKLQESNMASIAHPDDAMNAQKFALMIDDAYMKGSPPSALDMNGITNTANKMKELLPSQLVEVYTMNHDNQLSHNISPVLSALKIVS